MSFLSSGVVGNDGEGSALDQELAKPIAVVCRVCGHDAGGWQGRDQRECRTDIAELAWRDLEGKWASIGIGYDVDLGGSTAARPANRLRLRPPFPPAAERCTLVVVLSII